MAMNCWCCGQKVSEKARNYKFHCKLFVLFKIGYDNWEPEGFPKMNRDQFRKNVLILAGYYTTYFDFNGVLQTEAESISYAKMGAEKFEQCYQDCLDVIANRLLMCGKADLHDMVMEHF